MLHRTVVVVAVLCTPVERRTFGSGFVRRNGRDIRYCYRFNYSIRYCLSRALSRPREEFLLDVLD